MQTFTIEHQNAALFVAKSAHGVRPHFDAIEEPFDVVVRADRAPVLLGEVIEPQVVFQIVEQALHRVRDNGLPFGDKRFDFLLRFFPIGREIENPI